MKSHLLLSKCDKDCIKHINSIFTQAPEDFFTELMNKKSCTAYTKGEVIFKEGTQPYGVHCIHKGKVKLCHTEDSNREQIMRLLKEGDMVGHRSLLSDVRYSYSAVALDDVAVCFVPKELLFDVLRTSPAVAFAMMRNLSKELHAAEVKQTILGQKPVRERLAETLLFIMETYGVAKDKATLNVCFSREEISNLVCTATETVIRLLSEFQKEGMIALEGKKIKILKSDALLRIAANW